MADAADWMAPAAVPIVGGVVFLHWFDPQAPDATTAGQLGASNSSTYYSECGITT